MSNQPAPIESARKESTKSLLKIRSRTDLAQESSPLGFPASLSIRASSDPTAILGIFSRNERRAAAIREPFIKEVEGYLREPVGAGTVPGTCVFRDVSFYRNGHVAVSQPVSSRWRRRCQVPTRSTTPRRRGGRWIGDEEQIGEESSPLDYCGNEKNLDWIYTFTRVNSFCPFLSQISSYLRNRFEGLQINKIIIITKINFF